jgi:hypothetical protein
MHKLACLYICLHVITHKYDAVALVLTLTLLYYFSTIFDIDIEAFQQKPWRQQGVDLTDYFNFSLDEEGWRKYWCSMVLWSCYFVSAFV